jgi:ADP-ribosylglycohydrolase
MKLCLLGALWGDICGVPYEFSPERDVTKINLKHPSRAISDDTILTLAIAKAILEQRPYRDVMFEYACQYRDCGFGGMFYDTWIIQRKPEPYNSFGNGAAMRVSPIGWAFNTVEDVLREAEKSASCSHNHPKGIACAQATALAVFLARKGQDKDDIRAEIEGRFGYRLTDDLEALRCEAEKVGFNATWVSVPQAISAFLATDSFDSCLRETIALGCDADTQAAISGAIAEAYYGVDESLARQVTTFLNPQLKQVWSSFAKRYGVE